jgi:Rrf2 family protein
MQPGGLRLTSRFTMALHALGMIAREGERSRGGPVTSAALARSINTNPVVVRRVLADLRRAGLVETRRGVGGGVALARPASRISLRAVWESLADREQIFGRHPSGPNPHCPVGRCTADYLEELYGDAEEALKASLGKVTLAELQRDVAVRLRRGRGTATRGPGGTRAPPPRAPRLDSQPSEPSIGSWPGLLGRHGPRRPAGPVPHRRARAAGAVPPSTLKEITTCPTSRSSPPPTSAPSRSRTTSSWPR